MVMLKQFHNSFIHHSYNRASRGAQYHAIITSGAFAKSLQMMIQKYFFSCSNENQYTRNQFYLRCVLSWGCIIVKPFSIVAVLQIVLCNRHSPWCLLLPCVAIRVTRVFRITRSTWSHWYVPLLSAAQDPAPSGFTKWSLLWVAECLESLSEEALNCPSEISPLCMPRNLPHSVYERLAGVLQI